MRLFGREAVDWLGAQLSTQILLPATTVSDDPEPARLQHAGRFLPDLPWMSLDGGHWLRENHLQHPSRTWQLV